METTGEVAVDAAALIDGAVLRFERPFDSDDRLGDGDLCGVSAESAASPRPAGAIEDPGPGERSDQGRSVSRADPGSGGQLAGSEPRPGRERGQVHQNPDGVSGALRQAELHVLSSWVRREERIHLTKSSHKVLGFGKSSTTERGHCDD